ncbi:MAG: 50S ribosomal protein L29 [Planctomycetaceae bacterium]|nr:50S ribosomal protein L29 [Planctomycetaceae bacterium]|tara:strand:- start:471 stop:746 length:276 start_codon:yes stop_codon:yes gene_type:complete
MTKAAELREMSDEQLGLTLKDTCEHFFRLRIQAQTERLDAPSELKKNRRLIARIKTIQRERSGGLARSQAGDSTNPDSGETKEAVTAQTGG